MLSRDLGIGIDIKQFSYLISRLIVLSRDPGIGTENQAVGSSDLTTDFVG